ncbi:MAG: SDR family oxidoreductase [Candidatus Obscuribacterales bacterium]|jgi:nucleoside-diphosphate-sugar epimerase
MKVFLTGASGYVGSRIGRLLTNAGYSVNGLARNDIAAQKLLKAGIEPVSGNLNEPERLARLASSADAIIHTAFIHNFGQYSGSIETECNLMHAFGNALAGSNKPLLVTSATGVVGDTGANIATEETVPDLSHPLSMRHRAEQAALATANNGIKTMVLRLPILVYGHAGSTFIPMMMESGQKRRMAAYIESGENALCAAHVDDVVAGYMLALEKGEAGDIFQLSAESEIPVKTIAEAVGRTLKVPAQSISAGEANEVFGEVVSMFFGMNNRASGDKAMQKLGWAPQEGRTLLSDIEQGSYATAFALSGR